MSRYSDLLLGTSGLVSAWPLDEGSGALAANAGTEEYRDSILAADPVSYWRFEETSGTVADDLAGANDGTYTGGVLLDQRGIGRAASFDGTDDRVALPNNMRDADQAGTVEAWIKTSAVIAANANRQIFGMGDGGSSQFFQFLVWGYATNDPRVMVGQTGGSGLGYAVTGSPVPNNAWTHVVATSDGSAVKKIYLNGVLQVLSNVFGTNNADWFADVSAGTSFYRIGASSASGSFFPGSIDEVALYDRALTATEVADHHTQGRRAINAGTYTGGVSLAQPGPIYGHTATSFDGVDGTQIVVPSAVVTAMPTTLECWAYLSGTSLKGTFLYLGKQNAGAADNGIAIAVGSGTGDTLGNELLGLYEAERWIPSGVGIGTGWHYVALSVTGAGVGQLYLDGVAVNTPTGVAPRAPTETTLIGGSQNAPGVNLRYFNGRIAWPAIYNRALTAAEVLAHYELGLWPGPTPRIREKPPLRLHIDAETPSGKHYRWGEDEPGPANVPGDLRFSSTMPGGFESLDVTLPRKPGVSYSDLERLSTLKSIGPGGEVAGEYRLERAPKVSGDKMAVSPSAVGHQAHLEDDKSARIVYVDRDLSAWTEASRTRRIALLGAAYGIEGSTVLPDEASGLPALAQVIRLAGGARPYSEALYDAGAGLDIAAVYYDFTNTQGGTTAPWTLIIGTATADDHTGGVDSTITAASGVAYHTPAVAKRCVYLEWFYDDTIESAADLDRLISWRNLSLYGNHGLTRRGADPGGFYASDVIEHAVGKWAPLLNFSDDTIQPANFIIPHLVFKDPTTAAEIIRQANRFHLYDWAVWEDKTFYYHQRGARGRTWRARISPAQLEETGPQMDRLWESVLVSFQDVDGTTKTVGPPGSGADTESTLLKDSDPENPANKLGIIRRDLLAMGTSTAAAAAEVGARFLAEQKLLDTSGRAQLVGHVEDDRGVVHPAWKVRAGDTIVFVDASDPRERRVVKADYSHDTRTCSIDLDAPPEGLAALLERLGVVLVPLGVS